MKQPEHTFQAWADRFLDRVVLRPCEVRGIDQAHRDMRNIARQASLLARGCKPGTADHYVAQAPSRSIWLELKWGTAPSPAQIAFGESMWNVNIPYAVCRSMHDILDALRRAAFKLHANADNLAIEYQQRAEAAIAALKSKPFTRSKPRAARPSLATIKRVERNRMLP